MNNIASDLTILVPEFPQTPQIEIPRDGLVKRISESFGPDCQKQVIVSNDYYGKTNFMAQFCRQYPSYCISYFITSNPITQNYRNFLFVICNQISKIIKGESLEENISEANLRNLFLGLSVKLGEFARQNKKIFYFVIDGIEFALNNDFGLDIVTSPPTTAKLSPYLLYSANKKTLERLPDQFKRNVKTNEFEAAFQFNFNNTEKYLEDLKLTNEDVKYIHDKSKGIVGYLAVVRDSIKMSGKDWIYKEGLPDELHRLIKNQVDHVFLEVRPVIKNVIELVSISPKPINIGYLREFFQEELPISEIAKTELLVINEENETISLKHDLAKNIINEKLGAKTDELKKSLLEVVKRDPNIDNELLTLLLEELKDYNGLVSLVETTEIKKAIDTGNTNIVLTRLKAIINLSLEEENLEDLTKWGWLLTSTKEFLTQTTTTSEINALISIGDSSQAIEMSYNFPELITKINLLANIYTKMKERHEHVSSSALNELELMINELQIDKYEKEMVKSLAINLFVLFPEKSMQMLDTTIGNQSAIDAAFTNHNSNLINGTSVSFVDSSDDSPYLDLFYISSTWLKKFTFVQLLQKIESMKGTKVKEYLIRQWCKQKETDDELSLGIELWLDTVISDEEFIISLRSLRKISELLPNLNIEDRSRLRKRLQNSAISSLRTPWQEWVGFRLNVAKSSYEYDKKNAVDEIEEIYNIVNTQIEDLDIKVFCYAKLWGTYKELGLLGEQDIKNNFERVVSALLEDSAMQDEIFDDTLKLLSEIDIDYALEIGGRLNTNERRIKAKKTTLINAYENQPQIDYSSELRNTLQYFDSYNQEILVFELINAISEKELTLDKESQKILFFKSRDIKNQIIKSITLVNLASIWTRRDIIKVPKMLQEAEDSWKNEDDLKKKIIFGYVLVEKIAKIDVSLAREFYNTVQSTLLLPGAELAVGRLGSIFTHSLDFAIRSLDNLNILNEENIEIICEQISELPTAFIRQKLYAQLAAKLFRIGNNKKAEDVVQEEILNNLT